METTYRRPAFNTLMTRLKEPRKFIQVLAGPRQTGKTTLAQQVMKAINMASLMQTADSPTLRDSVWIEQVWNNARRQTRLEGKRREFLLVLDEVQKVPGWQETVKRLWDEDSAEGIPVKAVILGSSPLLMQKGLTESLAGRFELIHITHWLYTEMKKAFGWDLEQYLFFGGYPGAALLIEDQIRWSDYINDSLVETTISRDIFLMTNIQKPALLRRLFQLGCDYSGQILSYNKMLGQLQDAGNTTTLAEYLKLLSGAGMLTGIEKYSGSQVRRRASSPKLNVLNTSFITSQNIHSIDVAQNDPAFWGRLVESAIGAHLINSSMHSKVEVFYWRDRNKEVDFVLRLGDRLAAIEVKSGRNKGILPGMEVFNKKFAPVVKLLVGEGGVSIKEFLSRPASHWLE